MAEFPVRRVVAIAPMPPEKSAYALARYSRSADSIRESVDWVRANDSQKFLESFYFKYGHASIADLGHVALCLEGISELAATDIEDEQLWDGQAKSSRYQDFSKSGFLTPPEFDAASGARYREAGDALMAAYRRVQAAVFEHLCAKLPRPEAMKPDAYERNLTARAFDVARYLLFLGVPTNVGQVTSIRTLERQIRRLKASEFQELREVGAAMAEACSRQPEIVLDKDARLEPVAPTLAKYVDADAFVLQTRAALREWARQNLPAPAGDVVRGVTLHKPANAPADIVATLLYPVSTHSYGELYELAAGWSEARRAEVLGLALAGRGRGDEVPRAFRTAPYAFDIVMDIGAYRDLHRHRRCQQFRQEYTAAYGYETPAAVAEAGVADVYDQAMRVAREAVAALPAPAGQALLPFGTRSRFLFKMDFAETEYISKLRSGVKGHFSYRQVAWEMKLAAEKVEPELARLIQATPPWIEDPLTR